MRTQAPYAPPHLLSESRLSGMGGMDVPELIRALLRGKGISQGDLGAMLGVKQSTISRWLSGKQLPDFKQVQALQAFVAEHGLSDGYVYDRGTTRAVFIVGIVGLGEEIEWIGEAGLPLEEVRLPFSVPEDCIALEAKGDSMAPRVKNGEILVILTNGHQPRDHLNEEAVVKLRDGPYLFKTIRRGYTPGLFNLESYNGVLREDVDIEWVGELWAIIPSRRWTRIR